MAARKAPRTWIPTRPDPRGAAPALLGELLVGADTFIAQKTGAAIPREEWRNIVGARIANRTRVGRLYRGVLTLYVASSAWSNELSFLKQSLIAKLQAAGREIFDLRFNVEQIQAPKSPIGRRLHPASATNLAAELPDELVMRLQQVEDPTLRAAITQAARRSLTKKP